MAGRSGSFWPSAEQEALLTIALENQGQALAAWKQIRTRIDLDTLEPGSFTLLPLVYRALSQGEVKDSRLERLKGIYRSVWARNQLLLDAAKDALTALAERALVVGGLANGARFYADLALRPTPMLDLVVRMDDRAVAGQALVDSGWRRAGGDATHDWFEAENDALCSIRTVVAMDLDLDPWPDAERVDLDGTPVWALAPTDQLLASIVTGARATHNRSIAWIPDSVLIIRSGRVDWDAFVRRTRAGGQTARVREALAYLRSRASVPVDVEQGLAREPVSMRERVAYRLTSTHGRGLARLGEHLGSS